MLATDGTWRHSDSTHAELRNASRVTLVSSLVLLLAVGAFLCARRLSGAVAAPLSTLPLITTAMVILLWASALRMHLRDRMFSWLLAITVLLFAIACSFPGERAVDWIVWLGVAAVYLLIPTAPARRSSPATLEASDDGSDLMLQQVWRTRSANGAEIVRGTLIAEFAPGERSATLHVAFCPPFERLPEIEMEPTDGPDCDLKTTQLLHQGARIEVRLSRASTAPERVTVEFVAAESPPLAV